MRNLVEKDVVLHQLLENGVHLGHHKNKWNAEMSSYLLGIRSKTHIIDLEKTLVSLRKAMSLVQNVSSHGGKILFISTIPEFSHIIEMAAKKAGQPYINRRWIGGLLTNFTEIRKKLTNLKGCSHKFIYSTQGIRSMSTLPDMIFVIGINNCTTALHEASLLNIPCIGIVDSNTSVQNVTYPIPGNDDSILAVNLYCQLISNAILSGSYHSIYQD